MARGKKVVPLNPEVKELRFPDGDPRNDMTLEEIDMIARQEEAELDRMLAKAPPLAHIAPSGVEEEDDEDTEDFKVDLSKGLVTQEVARGGIIRADADGDFIRIGNGDREKLILLSEPVPQLVEVKKPEDEYGRVMTDALVRQGIRWVIKRMNKDLDVLEKAKNDTLSPSIREVILNEQENVEEQIRELRRSLPVEGLTDGVVRYENIPAWAEQQVKRYIKGSISQLTRLVDEDDI